MTIVHAVQGGRILAALNGDLDLTTAKPLREALDALLDRHPGRDLTLDLTEVGFIDSSGLGVILGRYRRMHAEGRVLTLVGAKPNTMGVLEVAGIPRIISVVESPGNKVIRDKRA